MCQWMRLTLWVSLLLPTINGHADAEKSSRTPLFTNDKVTVWRTEIYPDKEHILKMHRHEHNRVIVALNSGTLKITDNQGKVHYLDLVKDQAYYLTKDIPNTLHTDENISRYPIKVIVMELK